MNSSFDEAEHAKAYFQHRLSDARHLGTGLFLTDARMQPGNCEHLSEMNCLFELTPVFQWGCLKFKNASIMAMHVHALPTVDQDVKDPCARIQVMLQLITYHNISHYSHPQSHFLVFHCFLYHVDSKIISAVFNFSASGNLLRLFL